MNDLRHLCHLAAGKFRSPAPPTYKKSERIDAVADHQFAGNQALEAQTIHFVPRQAQDIRSWGNSVGGAKRQPMTQTV